MQTSFLPNLLLPLHLRPPESFHKGFVKGLPEAAVLGGGGGGGVREWDQSSDPTAPQSTVSSPGVQSVGS